MTTAAEYRQMEHVVQTIEGCARCGKGHKDLVFSRLIGPGDEYTHYATCPNTRQPVLLMFRDIEEAK